jgi:hypothetical protein
MVATLLIEFVDWSAVIWIVWIASVLEAEPSRGNRGTGKIG